MAEEAALWAEYGCSMRDPRAALPAPEYRAHLAILTGKSAARERERAKVESTGRKPR